MAHHSHGEVQTSPADLLLGYLEELGDEEQKVFKFKLSDTKYKGLKSLPWAQVKDLDKVDLASKMTDYYGQAGALNVMLIILKNMNLNDLAQRLNEDLQKGPTAGSELGDTPQRTHPPMVSNQSAVAFVDQHRTAIIKKVLLIDPILDDLLKHIGEEKCNYIRAPDTSQDRIRRLYGVLNSDKLKMLFFDSLKENESSLVSELKKS